MSKLKNNRLGLIGLCITAALSLMAFGAAGAQAAGCTAGSPTLKPCWMLGGANVTSNTTVKAVLSPEEIEFENGTGVDKVKAALLLTETSVGPTWISCKKAEGTAVTIEAGGKASGNVEFNECTTSLSEGGHMKLLPNCNPTQPISAGGHIEIVLHESEPYARVYGNGDELVFAEVKFPENGLCSGLEGNTFKVKGWTFVKDCKKLFEKEELTHLVEEAELQALALEIEFEKSNHEKVKVKGGLFFGTHSAKIDGSGILEVFKGTTMETFSGLAS